MGETSTVGLNDLTGVFHPNDPVITAKLQFADQVNPKSKVLS